MRLSFNGTNNSIGTSNTTGGIRLEATTDAPLSEKNPCFTVITNVPSASAYAATYFLKRDNADYYKSTIPFGFGGAFIGAQGGDPKQSSLGYAIDRSQEYNGCATDNFHAFSGGWDFSKFASGANCDANAFRYNVPINGYYHFSYGYLAGQSGATETGAMATSLCINGGAAFRHVYSTVQARMTYENHNVYWNYPQASVILKCFAGDYVDVRVSDGSSENSHNYYGPDCNHFSGKLIGRF